MASHNVVPESGRRGGRARHGSGVIWPGVATFEGTGCHSEPMKNLLQISQYKQQLSRCGGRSEIVGAWPALQLCKQLRVHFYSGCMPLECKS